MKINKIIVAILLLGFTFTSCKKMKEDSQTTTNLSENPLLAQSTLPYGAPDFDKIKDEHFKPALEEGMRLQNILVDSIVNNQSKPTFENTIVALEKSGETLRKVSNIFYALTEANTNEVIQEVQEEIAPKLSSHYDEINLNSKLFQKIKTIYNQKDSLDLDQESKTLVENYYKNSIKAGANLSDADKEKLKRINSELAILENKFSKTLLDANNAAAVIVKDSVDLEGLTTQEKNAKKTKDGEWSIPIQNTTQQPVTQSLTNRVLREGIFKASWKRTDGGNFNTNQIITKMVQLRVQKAKLLGFNNFAEWSLQQSMVENPTNIKNFFAQLIPATTAKARLEANEIQQLIKESGDSIKLEPWDWNYYSEKVRKAKYDLNENEIKPYFELRTVLEKGVFYAANKLYGITYKERKDIPTYHPDVWVYELFNEDGSQLGLFYADYYARESKRGGAWMSNFVDQSFLYDEKPVIYNVCNYVKPAEGEPSLITYDDVETMFHEFGHALHGFFANQKYPSISGTSVARDFVEYPSQANEHWALYPEVLKNYAKHHQTGESMPEELIDKIKKASTFNQGFALTEVLAAADLDMNFHTLTSDKLIEDVTLFEKEVLTKDNLWMNEVPPRYRSSYFLHIFGGGYAAGYYAYLWTEMLSHDTGAWFDENGGLKRENGQRYRDMILSKGNTEDYATMYKAFRGSEPKIEPMLKARGLK